MKITIIGSGNVATHISLAFKKIGVKTNQIYSRNYSNAQKLAKIIDAKAISHLTDINDSSDIYFVAVSDKAIFEVAEMMPKLSGIVAHTAGCVPISILSKFSSYGSFYPYQTFTNGREIDFAKINLFVEGNNHKTEKKMFEIASKISCHVEIANIQKRTTLHLAAVFGCNFTNHLYNISQKILEDVGLSFDYLKPIIEETASKACEMKPFIAQTGPAVRKDLEVMNFQLEKLKDYKHFSDIYNLISKSIMNLHNNDKKTEWI